MGFIGFLADFISLIAQIALLLIVAYICYYINIKISWSIFKNIIKDEITNKQIPDWNNKINKIEKDIEEIKEKLKEGN